MADTTNKTMGTMSDNKDLPSPVRRSGGPLALYGEVVREMKKVTWPTWKETYLTTFMVFVMVALTVVFFFFIDTVLSWGERLLVGAVG